MYILAFGYLAKNTKCILCSRKIAYSRFLMYYFFNIPNNNNSSYYHVFPFIPYLPENNVINIFLFKNLNIFNQNRLINEFEIF